MEGQNKRRTFLKYLFSLLAFGTGSIISFNKGFKMGKSSPIMASHSEAQGMDSSGNKIKKIAVEEHFVSEKVLNYLASRVKSGAKYNSTLPYEVSSHAQSLIGDKRLKDMDEAGIDMQVISPVCFHECLVDPNEATALAKLTNDELYEIIKKYPKRFAGFAGLACQDPDAAAKELERAVKDLGLKGAIIYSHIQGEYLDAKKFWGIFEMAEKLNVPIYLHPKEPSPDIIKPYLTYPALAGKIWGYGAEVSLHASRLIGSGLFDKYPGLQIILGHGGESLPFWLWRMDRHSVPSQGNGNNTSSPPPGMSMPSQGNENSASGPPANMSSPRNNDRKQSSEYVKGNFYVTTSGMFWGPVLQFLHSAMGPDRVLFAVDYPAESNNLAVQSIESLSISSEDKEKVFHLNTERLLKL